MDGLKIYQDMLSFCNIIIPFVVLIFLIFILIWNIVLIHKNIANGKEKNKIIRYSLKRILLTGLPLIVILALIAMPKTGASMIADEIYYIRLYIRMIVFQIILFCIYFVVMLPQIVAIINLRKSINRMEVEKIEKTSDKNITLLVITTVIVYILIVYVFIRTIFG